MKYLIIFIMTFIFIVFVILGVYNDQIINFNFLLMQNKFRLSTLCVCLFGTGLILGCIVCGFLWLRVLIYLSYVKYKLKRAQAQNKRLVAITKLLNTIRRD